MSQDTPDDTNRSSLYGRLREMGYTVTSLRTRCKVTHPEMIGHVFAPMELDETGERKLRSAITKKMKAYEAALNKARVQSRGPRRLMDILRPTRGG